MHAVENVGHPAFDAGVRNAPSIPQDASDGLQRYTDAQGAVWAYNPSDQEWQRLHRIAGGDTLWKLSGTYFGSPSLPGVHAIHRVPQNMAIQGGDANTGLIPGDVILIPQLPQPGAPPAVGGGSTVPIGEVPQVPIPGVPDTTVPGFGSPGVFPIPITVPTIPGEVVVPGVPAPIMVGAPPAAVSNGVGEPKFWTTGKIVAAGAAGVAGLAILFTLTRKGKRRGR